MQRFAGYVIALSLAAIAASQVWSTFFMEAETPRQQASAAFTLDTDEFERKLDDLVKAINAQSQQMAKRKATPVVCQTALPAAPVTAPELELGLAQPKPPTVVQDEAAPEEAEPEDEAAQVPLEEVEPAAPPPPAPVMSPKVVTVKAMRVIPTAGDMGVILTLRTEKSAGITMAGECALVDQTGQRLSGCMIQQVKLLGTGAYDLVMVQAPMAAGIYEQKKPRVRLTSVGR